MTPERYQIHDISEPDTTRFLRELRQKFYEHKDHLGNVRMTFSDMKNRTATGIFYLDSLTVYDYYPYGMLKPGRYYEDAWSRYGFNGKEMDNTLKGDNLINDEYSKTGTGNSYDFGARIFDPRLGRWFSRDPIFKPDVSPYISMGNNPIILIDPDGMDEKEVNLLLKYFHNNMNWSYLHFAKQSPKVESAFIITQRWDLIKRIRKLLDDNYNDNYGKVIYEMNTDGTNDGSRDPRAVSYFPPEGSSAIVAGLPFDILLVENFVWGDYTSVDPNYVMQPGSIGI